MKSQHAEERNILGLAPREPEMALGWAGSAGHPLLSEHDNHTEVQSGVCARSHLISAVQAFRRWHQINISVWTKSGFLPEKHRHYFSSS